ncbi:MAG: type III-B CRISPR module RAMP protein Cmr1 [Candidatus Electrothrix sp. GW3-4]|uniref:type III-B CRISPR module RAMP protein Cmr1 n=1 Tax=Candidatus Electrothrix sp. GW3-4 TaxID=3126740 RepID=UPI0030D386C0
MRLRVPDKNPDEAQGILDSLKAGDKERKKEKWLSYKIEVITPIFGGGVEAGKPDTKMPVRASAIRGQLRYWWRFLATNRRIDPLSGEDLFKAERDIWGGMAEPGEDFSSKVRIRVENVTSHITPQPYNEGGAPYALFPAREQKKTHDPAKKLIWPKVTFDLKVRVLKDKVPKEEDRENIKRALRWWATFGGIGARTRRGCGSLYCAVLSFSREEAEEEADKTGCELVIPQGTEYAFEKATDAWKRSIIILQQFRQLFNETGKWIGVGRRINEQNRKQPGTSRWPEANAIRETTGKSSDKHRPRSTPPILFPRAMFGMPLGFAFLSRSDRGKPPETELLPVKGDHVFDRLASPLILKPIVSGGRFKPAALLMPCSHIKELGLKLRYKKQLIEKQEKKTASKRTFGRGIWWDESKATLVDPIKDYGGTDALTAFMNFFARGGR